jgi:hypothetical protein
MEWVALATCAAAGVSLLGWVILRCRFGFDFTDEGFYLNWISNPWNYQASVFQFGFVYHPLYKLVGGDIALLRQINVSIIFALSCVLCIVLVRSLCWNWTAFRPSQRAGFVGVAVAVASSSLAFFDLWLPTPNYNSLAFQAVIIVAIGGLLANRKLSKGGIAGWILIGIGGGLAFLAKPTTAVMLGCMIAGYIVVAGKFALRGVLVSLATATLFLVISGLAIDGSLSGFLRRLTEGLDMINQLDSRSNHLFRWDDYDLSHKQKTRFDYVLIVTYVSATLGFLANGRARLAATSVAALLAGMSIATIAGVLSPKIYYEPFQPMVFWAISFGIVLSSIIVRSHRLLSRNSLALIVLFIILPYAYAFGTNNNLWTAASRAALFWMLAGFVVSVELAAENGAWRMLLPAAAAALLVSTVILYVAMENPYRQTQPLRLQASAVEINRERSTLFLTDETASYVHDIYRLANENGFRTGEPVLDLTGTSPGSLYVIGARPLGAAWMLGGYSGSNIFLTTALDQETCESIGASWILTEPSSRDSFPPGLLQRFGIDMDRDYLDVGSVSSVRSFFPMKFEHRLFKPTRSLNVARLACEEARRMDRR